MALSRFSVTTNLLVTSSSVMYVGQKILTILLRRESRLEADTPALGEGVPPLTE